MLRGLLGESRSYRFTIVRLEKLSFYSLAGIMGEIDLLLAVWDGSTRWNGWDGNGMERQVLAVAVSGASPLSFEVRLAAVSSGCHRFHQCCRWGRLFVSVQKIFIIRCTQI